MKSQAKRLAILSLPEARELYSVPQLSPHEQDYFFTLSEEELAAVNCLGLLRNRILLVLMLGYFKVNPLITEKNDSVRGGEESLASF
ncbi:MAG: DUF4158 domain-containing protein [Exilibacterium sp.]